MVRVRPLEVDDGDALAAIDAAYAGRSGDEPVATRGALSFYARTGHAFVAEDANGTRGFALAQAVWDGTRPTVQLRTLATEAADAEARAALLEAVTKSAYDAAVYDLVARAPLGDPALDELLRREGWRAEPVASLRRTLGSRGAS
jgi:hypothetical protein